MIGFLGIPAYYWHPLGTGAGSTCSGQNHTGCGYAFWSGLGSDIGELTIVGGLATLVWQAYRARRCHADGCWRLSWSVHPAHGHPLCFVHHPHGGAAAHLIGGRER